MKAEMILTSSEDARARALSSNETRDKITRALILGFTLPHFSVLVFELFGVERMRDLPHLVLEERERRQ